MKTRILRALMMSGLLAWPMSALAQDINFKDLARPGYAATKRVVIVGSRAESDRLYEEFAGSDSGERIAAAERAASYAASSSSAGASSGSSSSAERGQEYVCKFTCYGVNSGMFNNKSNGGGAVSVRAESYDAAKRMVVGREKSLCSGSTLTKNQAWGGDSVDCSRK